MTVAVCVGTFLGTKLIRREVTKGLLNDLLHQISKDKKLQASGRKQMKKFVSYFAKAFIEEFRKDLRELGEELAEDS